MDKAKTVIKKKKIVVKEPEIKNERLAVIAASGRQFIVKPGQVITLDKYEGKDGEMITFENVLLVADGDNILIGKPNVQGAKVIASLLNQEKGDKIRVAKFKSKVRYRKVMGFRAKLTKVKIVEIQLS